MRNVLLLTSVMKRGYGVSVVAREVADRIGSAGWNMMIGCLEYDEFYCAENVIQLRPSSQMIFEYCQENSIEIVVAQTSPYFEVLPALEMWIPTVVFEHGDPTPTMFEHDVLEREQVKVHKLKRVYPKVDAVLTSSYFLRDELLWPKAKVIALGCDHVTDYGQPSTQRTASDHAPLRVGTLMRLGSGEALYKGLDEYLAIVSHFTDRPGFDFSIMGRGEESDRRSAAFTVTSMPPMKSVRRFFLSSMCSSRRASGKGSIFHSSKPMRRERWAWRSTWEHIQRRPHTYLPILQMRTFS